MTRNYDTKKEILLNNLLIIFLSNAFVSPMYSLSNIWYFLKKLNRSKLEKKFNDEDTIPNKTQRELNELYENTDMYISFKYSYLTKTFLMTVFYLPLFPAGAFISIIGISLVYIVDKFNLLNTNKRPQMLNAKICLFYVRNFKFAIFIYALGNFIFLENAFYSNFWAEISLLVFLFLLFIPFHFVLKCTCIGYDEHELLKKDYEACVLDFPTNYDRQNPISKKVGHQRYLERLKNDGYISEDQFLDLKEKIMSEDINMIEIYYRNSADMKTRLKNKILNLFDVNYNEKKNIFDASIFRNALLSISPNTLQKNFEYKKKSSLNYYQNKQKAIINFMRDTGIIGYKPNNINNETFDHDIHFNYYEENPLKVNSNVRSPINTNNILNSNTPYVIQYNNCNEVQMQIINAQEIYNNSFSGLNPVDINTVYPIINNQIPTLGNLNYINDNNQQYIQNDGNNQVNQNYPPKNEDNQYSYIQRP